MNIPFDHPSIEIAKPADGHYIITGQPGGSTFIEGQGHLAIEPSCHIHPGIPSDALLAILADRGDISAEPPGEEDEELLSDVEAFIKHVGAETFRGAADTLIRTNAGHMDQVEQQFNKIKELGRELDELRKENENLKTGQGVKSESTQGDRAGDEESKEDEKPKRHRRTKAEMEAARAAGEEGAE